jgi:beta-lactamase class A
MRLRPLISAGAVLLLQACGGSDDRKAPDRHADAAPAVVVEMRAPPAIVGDVDAAIRTVEGPVGISIYSFGDGWRIDRGCSRRLPQQSVSKLWVAIALMEQVDRARIGLYDPVTVTPSDRTLFHQPVVALVGEQGYRTTVLDLLLRAMTQSDNTANDRLLSLVGGPAVVNDMLARHGVRGVVFGPGERLLQSGTAGLFWNPSLSQPGAFQRARARLPASARLAAYRRYVAAPPDGATACGVVDGLAALREGRILSKASTQTLLSIMGASVTGHARLRAGLAPGWLLSHKTGTGQQYAGRTSGFNDVGILTSPEGDAYAVAVMIGDSGSGDRARQHLIRDVARAVVAQQVRRGSGF